MDFDTRLSILTPLALQHPIDKRSALWSNYKKAKGIRNGVTHSGKRVSEKEARFVVETVRSWLDFLGSTVELDAALLALKQHIETREVFITNERQAIGLVQNYFQNTRQVQADVEVPVAPGLFADLVLRYDDTSVLVEAKLIRGPFEEALNQSDQAIAQVRRYMRDSSIDRAAVVIFTTRAASVGLAPLRSAVRGTVSVITIGALK